MTSFDEPMHARIDEDVTDHYRSAVQNCPILLSRTHSNHTVRQVCRQYANLICSILPSVRKFYHKTLY